MAGIVYRNCAFDDVLGNALARYQTGVRSRHMSFRATAASTYATLERMTSFDDIDEALLALVRLYGQRDIDAFREAMGLGARMTTSEEFELWVLEHLGIAIVNGIYVSQHRSGVPLAPYRSVYEVTGLTTLEAGVSAAGDGDYAFYIQYEGILFSGTPDVVAADLGVSFSDLDITFVWYGSTNRSARLELRGAGFPSDSLYNIIRGNDHNNVTTVVLPRLDLFERLRLMGFNSADIETLLQRDIARILIDSQRNRSDDATEATNHVYQPHPYPGELAELFKQEWAGMPPVGQLRAASGARIMLPPAVAVMRCLDTARSFPTQEGIAKNAERTDIITTTGDMALLAAMETNARENQTSWEAMVNSVTETASRVSNTIEEAWAFFGVDIDCGRSDPEGWPNMKKMGFDGFNDLLEQVGFAEVDFSDLFNAGIGQMARAGSLMEGVVSSLDTLTCGAVNFDCMATAGAEQDDGGGYGDTGRLLTSVFDAEQVASVMQNLSGDALGAFGDFANSMYSAGNLLAERDQQCSQDSSIRETQGLMDAAKGDSGTSVVGINA